MMLCVCIENVSLCTIHILFPESSTFTGSNAELQNSYI